MKVKNNEKHVSIGATVALKILPGTGSAELKIRDSFDDKAPFLSVKRWDKNAVELAEIPQGNEFTFVLTGDAQVWIN